MTNLVTAFNDHFLEFVSDIQSVFPDDVDILTAKNALMTIRKANPKLLVKIWTKYVYAPYKQQIEAGDINFFLTKDYSSDLNKTDNMSHENQAKTIKYIQNLSKLSVLVPQ